MPDYLLKIAVMTVNNVSEFLQFIGLRLVEPAVRRAYASERITVFFTAILLGFADSTKMAGK
jgi:hypothetical protein